MKMVFILEEIDIYFF